MNDVRSKLREISHYLSSGCQENGEQNEELAAIKSREITKFYPALWEAYSTLGRACSQTGTLQGKTLRLVKLTLAIGAGSEEAVQSHARRAVDEGLAQASVK